MLKHRSRIAVLVSDLPAGREIRLLPAGRFLPADGRTLDVPGWTLDAEAAAQVIARFNARRDARVIDYEHQTLFAETNGQPAPAAGWFGALEWREGDGLYATDVEWTAKAAAHIEAREYRYISPVFSYDRQGRVLAILHAGITNNPGLDGLTDLAALTARFQQAEEESDMDLKALLAALGLADDKTEADAMSAIAALKAAAGQVDDLSAQIAALKAHAGKPDPAKFVPVDAVAALQQQVAALTAQVAGTEVDRLIEAGLADGRILPAMEKWARELGGKDVAQLKSYLDNASPVAVLKGTQTGGQPAGDRKDGELDETQRAVCRQMGVDPAAYQKTLQAAA